MLAHVPLWSCVFLRLTFHPYPASQFPPSRYRRRRSTMPSKKERARARKAKDDGKCERARVHVEKLMKTERDSEELRRLYCLDRIFSEKMTCSVCYDQAYFFGPGREMPLLEYGYNCSNAHIMCFKCWYAYTKDSPVGTPWKCPICSVMVAFMTDWPSGIKHEGGMQFDSGVDYYFQQGKKVAVCSTT